MDTISVVIPTFNRKDNWNDIFLNRSIRSVLKQTHKNIEIVVVIDGLSQCTKKVIDKIKKENKDFLGEIKCIETGNKVGGSRARNIGIENSTGEWIALLDDDDEWVNNKLEKQLMTLKELGSKSKKTFCFTSVLMPEKNQILPRKNWNNDIDLCEYLFYTHNGRKQGFIQTSTVFAHKELFNSCMFTEGLPQLQDWDWELKARYENKFDIIQVRTPLSYYYSDGPEKVSQGRRGPYFEKWLKNRKQYFDKKSYNCFFINIVLKGYVDKSISKKNNLKLILKLFFANISFKEIDKECLLSFLKLCIELIG
ncbi:glycosyltransferase family 2 protein [Enterococcus sp. 22-H-5-01]|uniref:glycosyltransferase family 2 protein n=1 Tax=Enterococcus sp. 22-H-5-01 TaxID=3418555 RepID=UPI003D0053FE